MNTKQNPAGLTAAAGIVLVWVAKQVGLDLPSDVALNIALLVTVAVSYFSPRNV